MPTEAEWEIAARGGSENASYPTGDDIEKSQANFFSSDTTAVMSYPPNGYGLYDMAGNVYEWCKIGMAIIIMKFLFKSLKIPKALCKAFIESCEEDAGRV